MTIEFADDFKGYGTNQSYMADGLYSSVSLTLVEDPDPNATGNVCYFAGFGEHLRRPLSGVRDTVGVAARYWFPALNNTSALFCRIEDVSIDIQVGLVLTSVGGLQAWKGSPAGGGTLIGETTRPVLTANAWNHVEVKAASGAGTLEIRVNGVSVLDLDSIDAGTGYAQIEWAPNDQVHGNADQPFYMKDMVVWDGLGTSNNDFLGTVQVLGRTTISDVLTGWTPSHGALQYPLLANSPPVDATDYLSAPNPPPGPSSFGLTQLPTDVTSVKALITQCRVRNTDGGDGNFQSSIVSGTDTSDGDDRPMTSAFVYYEDVHELDPDTSAPFTPAAANAAKLKINRTL